MTKKRKSKKKKNNQEIIITLLVIVVIVIFGYIIFNKFIIPVWEKYKERPIVTKEIPYEEEEKKEVQPVPAEEMLEVNLYFSDSQGMYLVPEKRKVEKTSNLAKQIIVELIKGPVRSDLYTAIPEGTSVNEVYIVNDIAYVDLSEEIFKNHFGGSSGELMAVYSIVNTLTAVPSIKAVQILIGGNERKSLMGHIDISMPLLRDEDWIKLEN